MSRYARNCYEAMEVPEYAEENRGRKRSKSKRKSTKRSAKRRATVVEYVPRKTKSARKGWLLFYKNIILAYSV